MAGATVNRPNAFRSPIVMCLLSLALASGAVVTDPAAGAAAERGVTRAASPEELAMIGIDAVDPSLAKDARHSIRIALDWLATKQSPEGNWSIAEHPAITALVVCGYLGDPSWRPADPLPSPAEKGLDFILRCVRSDGSIYVDSERGGGLKYYNTSLCLTALCATMDTAYATTIEKARLSLVGGQHTGSDVFSGGYGYDETTGRAYSDLSNTTMALEAIRMADQFLMRPDVMPKLNETTLDWNAAIRFIERVQNLPEHNDQAWAQNVTEDDRGGFVYHPQSSKAGDTGLPEGGQRLRSYGSMTYAGLLSFIYADVDREDPRVQAAADWIRRHYTVDENPGMGVQGLYYNYCTMAKALSVLGENPLPLPDGRTVNWRQDLVAKLVSLQRIEPETGLGFWVNDEGRWWENDPILATAYALFALEVSLSGRIPTAGM